MIKNNEENRLVFFAAETPANQDFGTVEKIEPIDTTESAITDAEVSSLVELSAKEIEEDADSAARNIQAILNNNLTGEVNSALGRLYELQDSTTDNAGVNPYQDSFARLDNLMADPEGVVRQRLEERREALSAELTATDRNGLFNIRTENNQVLVTRKSDDRTLTVTPENRVDIERRISLENTMVSLRDQNLSPEAKVQIVDNHINLYGRINFGNLRIAKNSSNELIVSVGNQTSERLVTENINSIGSNVIV